MKACPMKACPMKALLGGEPRFCVLLPRVCVGGGGGGHMGSAANNGATFTESMSDKEKLQDDGDGGCAPDTANGC